MGIPGLGVIAQRSLAETKCACLWEPGPPAEASGAERARGARERGRSQGAGQREPAEQGGQERRARKAEARKPGRQAGGRHATWRITCSVCLRFRAENCAQMCLVPVLLSGDWLCTLCRSCKSLVRKCSRLSTRRCELDRHGRCKWS